VALLSIIVKYSMLTRYLAVLKTTMHCVSMHMYVIQIR